MKRVLYLFTAAVATLGVSCLILFVCHATGLLAGAHLYPISMAMLWSIVPAVAAGILAAALPQRPFSITAIAFLGTSLAIPLCYVAVRTYLHRYVGGWVWGVFQLEYELQLTTCWAAATVCALLITHGRKPRAVILGAGLCVAAVLLPPPVFRYLSHEQELTVVFGVRKDGAAETLSGAVDAPGLSREDQAEAIAKARAALRDAGLQDDYRFTSIHRGGEGRPSLQVVVMNGRVTKRSFLPQPNQATIVYVQRGDNWERIPANAPLLDRSVEISNDVIRKDALAYFEIPDAKGIRLLGSVKAR